MLARGHLETRMFSTDAARKIAEHIMVGAAFAGCIHEFAAHHDVAVAATLIDVIMLEEHCRGQNDIGIFCRLGHELLVYHGEQVLAGKTLLHLVLVRCHGNRIGVLDE